MVSSPIYGKNIRDKGKDLNLIYDKYTHRLSLMLNCSETLMRPLVYLFISAVLDFVIWGEKEKTQMQLEFIYSALPERIKTSYNLHKTQLI